MDISEKQLATGELCSGTPQMAPNLYRACCLWREQARVFLINLRGPNAGRKHGDSWENKAAWPLDLSEPMALLLCQLNLYSDHQAFRRFNIAFCSKNVLPCVTAEEK